MSGVVFVSRDLMFAGRVSAAARAAGLQCQLSAALPEEASDDVAAVVVDLAGYDGPLAELSQQATERFPGAPRIAFGPHVHVGRLKAAREAGFDQVLTRGQFDATLPALMRQIASRGPSAG